MRAVIQRVAQASVSAGDHLLGEIQGGLVVLLGVAKDDTAAAAEYLADKTLGLRVFEDDQQKMNRSIVDVAGSILVISQFTLLGDCRKGRRPSFVDAAPPEIARELYEHYVRRLRDRVPVATGQFQAMMRVSLVNDGPVTILLDSQRTF